MSKFKSSAKKDICQDVTNSIIALIEKGTGSWQKGWVSTENQDAPFTPVSGSTGNQYNGVNRLILGLSYIEGGYPENTWFTYKQAKSNGTPVRKGEKSTQVVFYSTFEAEKENKNGDTEVENIPFLKSFRVFNVSQLEGYEVKSGQTNAVITEFKENKKAQLIIKNTDVKISEGGNRAFYSPSYDSVQVPPKEMFINESEFYGTLMHELVHSTGNKKRLDRKSGKKFGDSDYAKEELVAELGAAFLCAELDCLNVTLTNHASYLDSWLQVLKADKKAIFKAAADAQKASDFIINNWLNKSEDIKSNVA